jgi:hypothetical protein
MNISVGNLILAVGRRGSGKTTLLKYISSVLLNSKCYDWVRIISPTNPLNKDWSFIEDKYIISENIDDYLEQLYNNQKKSIQNGKTSKGLLILDDIAGSLNFRKKDKILQQIASTGRHFKITTIFITQYIKTASPIIRTQSDLIILMGRFSLPSIISIYEQYSPLNITDERDLKKKLDDNSKNYKALVIDNRSGQSFNIMKPKNFKIKNVIQ